jgi:hypothetical protein
MRRTAAIAGVEVVLCQETVRAACGGRIDRRPLRPSPGESIGHELERIIQVALELALTLRADATP